MKSNVLNSGLDFRRAVRRAAGIANDPDLLKELIRGARSKMQRVDDGKKLATGIVDKIKLFIRMLVAFVKGEYREIPWKSLLLIIGALLYFMVPLDMIPDFIPATGFVDDITVILLVFKAVSDDVNAFRRYEAGEVEDADEVIEVEE